MISLAFLVPEKWTKLSAILKGFTELAQQVKVIHMYFPPTHRSRILASQPSIALPSSQILRLLPCLGHLNIHGMDTSHSGVQLSISSMAQDIRTSGAPLAKIVLNECNVCSAEVSKPVRLYSVLQD